MPIASEIKGSSLCLTHSILLEHFTFMSRPLRIEYPGAWHHVMNRGRHKEKIFLKDSDYQYFITLLKDTSELFHIGITAYCLMCNHYHLLIHTPEGNLSRCMRHIGSVYTQWFNRTHKSDGQLFRGRYKAVLIEEERYLLGLVRYIHRNPLKAGIAETMDGYMWSSHHAYVSNSAKWDWLYKGPVYACFSKDQIIRKKEYIQYMLGEDAEGIEKVYRRKKLPVILGSESFIGKIREKYSDEKIHREIPETKLFRPSSRRIIEGVCMEYGVEEEALMESRRGMTNEHRNVAIYLERCLRGESLASIAKKYRVKGYSTVSSICTRLEKRMKDESALEKRITMLKEISIKKSQAKT